MIEVNNLYQGDCLDLLTKMNDKSVKLVYMDPPFFTQKKQTQRRRDNNESISFSDTWKNEKHYIDWLRDRIKEVRRVLMDEGSIFVHCDWHSSHRIRLTLDEIFGIDNFRNEIIWTYKRWTNSGDFLQRAHQSIYFYSKSKKTRINTIFGSYSPTTNLDQIWQKRTRDEDGRSKTLVDENGKYVPLSKAKAGVPLRDVWEIPYLNPTAKERVGYPTQKPLELLEKIISIGSDVGDIIMDPMCGSGTTLIAAKITNRKWIGMDISKEALGIAKNRLENPVKSESFVLKNGVDSFRSKVNKSNLDFLYILEIIGANPVYRNRNIDGFLRDTPNKKPIAVRILGQNESFSEVLKEFNKAIEKTQCEYGVLIYKTKDNLSTLFDFPKENFSKVLQVEMDRVIQNPKTIFQELSNFV